MNDAGLMKKKEIYLNGKMNIMNISREVCWLGVRSDNRGFIVSIERNSWIKVCLQTLQSVESDRDGEQVQTEIKKDFTVMHKMWEGHNSVWSHDRAVSFVASHQTWIWVVWTPSAASTCSWCRTLFIVFTVTFALQVKWETRHAADFEVEL